MSNGTFSVDDVQSRNAKKLARPLGAITNRNVTAQQPVFGYSLMLNYGQSKSIGEQGFPALTTTPAYPNEVFMLGASPRPVLLKASDKGVKHYTTFLDTNFHPLVCTNQDGDNDVLQTFAPGALTANNVSVTTSGSGESTVGTFTWAGPPVATDVFGDEDAFQCDGFTVATGNNALATGGKGNVFTINSVTSDMSGSKIVASGVSSAQPTSSPESGIVFAQVPTILYFGEEAGVTQLNELRALELDYLGVSQDTSRKWVMANG
jgi:hypothetical protein